MWKGLVHKELRELAPIAAIALLACFSIVGRSIGYRVPFFDAGSQGAAFVLDEFVPCLGFVAVPLAIALGLRQTVAESLTGTWVWLLHRPLPRTKLFAVKLIVGGGIYALCTALPIVWYACWAGTPGKRAAPFYWWMTGEAWLVWLTVAALYPASFLCGVWPGRWLGARIFALVGAGAILFLFALGFHQSSWWPLGWIIPPVLAVGLVSSILFIARSRDFS
ncbi:MAG TPA: hypothetical protein VHC22_14915 [Pirellulales bacterium]|nr:hypothetical protein [Pirellulales bacterium]